MEPNPIKLSTVTAAVLVFVLGEALAYIVSKQLPIAPLTVVGITRLIQIMATVWLIIRFERQLSAIGWAPENWPKGIMTGACWSVGFATLAVIVMGLAHWQGYDPLSFFRSDLSAYHLPTFFIVGGFIAPIFEEICFRGVIYGFMRKVGLKLATLCSGHSNAPQKTSTSMAVGFAVVGSTVIFAMLHSVSGLPVNQIVGGIVFALAYETSGNLMVPITIHVTGNLAIFSLALLQTTA